MNTSIIIPVHNQLQLLQRCISSVHEKTHTEFQIIVINDRSDTETTKFCQQLYESKNIHKLIHNTVSRGFSESCNQGIVASQNFDYICLLNSDTVVVTDNWIEKVIKCGESDQKIGCLGVLSNCATSQSVGKSIVKESDIQQYGDYITSLFCKYPRTTFVNGFCFFVKTKVQQQVGFLDVITFPHYGSEDDFTLRIREKDYELAIVDNVYVYHYSNQSYKDRRGKIVSNSFSDLLNKWGELKIRKDAVMSDNILNYLRDKINECCDIIIVVHNALQHLQKCIDSIRKHTLFNYQITIVDNDSNQETKNYLKNLKDVKIITNLKNYGFGYANNQALKQTNNKYVCFLNSDTIVTKNWLTSLINDLENNSSGIIGPVSNNVASEQKVDFPFLPEEQMIQDFSNKRSIEFKGKVVKSNRLIGFCLLTKREILQKSGCFDDRYQYNFEDDDLCLRIIEQGYEAFYSLSVFVYHFGGQSFNGQHNLFNKTLEKSKKLYMEKWFDTERIKHINEKTEKLTIVYILASNTPSGGVKVVFEHANRLKDRGHDVKIYCNENDSPDWFDLHVPIVYFCDYADIPTCDIAIGTYFTTLPILHKINAFIKIHFCQGYEALLYQDKLIISTIKDAYSLINEKIVVSKYLKDLIDKEFSINSNYVSNGIDQYVFSFCKHQRNKTPRILIVGNYDLPIKGVNIALDAVQKYLACNKGTLVRLASERSKFDQNCLFYDMTKMTQAEIAKVYESCDVTVCASYKVEGFSLPPLESMASGTPVITTYNGGVSDYAVNNENAMIVPVGDSKAILKSLTVLLSNNQIYSKLVENGLKSANMYPWFKQIDRLEGLLYGLYQKQMLSQKERLSICMIVKNEGNCLENCLESIKQIANEIIIVDTGSTDETIKIAKKFGAKIYHFEWKDDFSAARNFALDKVTQPWVFIIDADEIISKADLLKFKALFNDDVAYSFVTRNYVDSKNIESITYCSGEYPKEEKNSIGWCGSEKVRLFKTNKNVMFEGQVHELVEKSLEKSKIEIKSCSIPIHHYGYLKKKKGGEYLKLSQKKAVSDDPKALYELAIQYMALNNYDEALIIWRNLLKSEPKNFDYLAHIGTVFNLLNDYKQAEKYFGESLSIKDNEYANKHLGICYAKQEKYKEAYEVFKKVAYMFNDLKTMADFAHCCNVIGKYDEAIGILERCLKINRQETLSWCLLEIAYNEKGVELVNKNRLPQAMNMFRSALSINNEFEVARKNLYEISKFSNALNVF